MTTKLYIAGPMRGIADFNFPAFFNAEQRLVQAGYEVHNPARWDMEESGFDAFGMTGDEELGDHDFDLGAALAHDIDYILREADGVAVLHAWERSKGASAEVAAARAVGKPVRTVDEWVADPVRVFTGAPGYRSRDVGESVVRYDDGSTTIVDHATGDHAHVDAMPAAAVKHPPADDDVFPSTFHNHFPHRDGTLMPAGQCGGCDDARDLARAVLDGREDDPVGCGAATDAELHRLLDEARQREGVLRGRLLAARAQRDGYRRQLDERGVTDPLHNHLVRLSYPIPAADMRPVGECAACDAQREAFPPDGQPHDDDDFADDLAGAATDDGSIRARFARPGTATLQRGEEVRVTSATGGEKGMKLAQVGAVDPAALLAVAEVAGFGAQKYARYNYMRGYAWSLSFDAMMRHLLAFWNGEDDDPESGLPHLAHAGWHTLALLSFTQRGIGTDDRYKDGAA